MDIGRGASVGIVARRRARGRVSNAIAAVALKHVVIDLGAVKAIGGRGMPCQRCLLGVVPHAEAAAGAAQRSAAAGGDDEREAVVVVRGGRDTRGRPGTKAYT